MWHYQQQNGEQKGPVSEDSLRSLLENATLPPGTFIWREGMGTWMEANNAPEFSGLGLAKNNWNKDFQNQPDQSYQPNQSKFEGFRTYNVGGFTYLMAYFEAEFIGSGSVGAVADQFTQFVSNYAAKGFEFFRCDEVPFRVTPGCLSGLFGAKETYGHCTIVTFRKKMD